MRRIFLLRHCVFILACVFGLVKSSQAQTPEQYGFTALSSTFTPITGGTSAGINADDATSGTTMLPIGFDFVFCGTTYSTFKVSSNGWLSFINTPGTSSYLTNSDAQLVNIAPAVFPLWDDLAGNSGAATYNVVGPVGSRVFTMQWLNWEWTYGATAPTLSIQVKLYETTNIIEFIYNQVGAMGGTRSGSIGIATGVGSYKVLNNVSSSPVPSSTTFTTNLNTMPASGQLYRFSPPLPCTGTPTAGSIISSAGNTFCGTGTTTLSLSGQTQGTGITYQWQSSPTGAVWTNVGTLNSTTYDVPGITASTLYRVQVTCTNSSSTVLAGPILINVATSPVVGATSPVTAICSGNSTTITANGASTYTWAPGTGLSSTTGTTVTANPTSTTTYTVTGTLGSCSSTATYVMTVGTPFDITPVTATPSSLCAGGDAVLDAVMPSATLSYCTPTYSSGTGSGDYIGAVAITGTTLNNVTSGAPSPYYTMYPSSGSTTATLAAGTTYTIVLSAGTYGTNAISAWIDWNWDGVFDATEKLGQTTGLGAYPVSTSYTFTVPMSAYTGVHRLRVREIWNSSNLDPCLAGGFGETEDYDITITGGAQFAAATWTESLGGGTTLASTTAVPANANNITVDKTYSLSVTKDGCTATGSVSVTANPLPTGTMTLNTPTVCAGDQPSLTFTGTPNAEVVYNINGVNPQTVTLDGTGNLTTLAPVATANTTYDLVTVTNTTTSCSAPLTGTANVTVNPRPMGLMMGSTTVCRDQPATISYGTGSTNFPIYVTFSDGTTTYLDTAGASSENFPVPTDVAGVFNYEITALTDVNGCAAVAGDFTGAATVDVRPLPTATLTSTDAGVCAGGNTDVTITFTGDAPFIFSYYDGTGSVSPAPELTNSFTFNVSPSSATTYYVETLLGGSCLAETAGLQDSVTVDIWPNTAITTQPADVSTCSETSVTITMTATGENLNYVWYENGVDVSTLGANYTVADNTLTINNVSGLNGNAYSVMVSGACGPDQTSNDAILTESFGNDWTGITSTAWSDATNWSCGSIPTVTTNVLIPTGAANMPLVDIPTAICNDLTIEPGASVMFVAGANQLELHGDIMNDGTLDGSDGTVLLAGTAGQQISGPTTFGDLLVDGGSNKVLSSDATVGGILNLINGTVELGSSNLNLQMPWSQMGGSATSYIITNGTGTVTGEGMGAVGGNPDEVTFHVGINGTSYTPIKLENLGDADDYSVRVMENVYVDGDGTDPTEVTNPVVDRTWMVSEGTAGGSIVNMTPYWNTVDEINVFDQTHVYVAHHMNGEWTADIDSAINAPAALPFGSMWMTTEDSIMSFSPFTVASYGQFPLSIRLTSISALNAGPRNKVEWKSATEAAGDNYELERSADAKSFTKIATIAANGKPSTYLHWDESPVQGVNYYRVKLVDANGNYSYSKVVSATVKGTNDFTIEAYPNPVRSTVSVKVNGMVTGRGSVVVTDVTGKVVTTATAVENNSAELNVSHLANGMYLLNYTDDVRNESIKINKQ